MMPRPRRRSQSKAHCPSIHCPFASCPCLSFYPLLYSPRLSIYIVHHHDISSTTMLTRPSPPPPDALRFLSGIPLFAGLDSRTLADIADQIRWGHIHGGRVLFRQGDVGDALYLVVSGRLRVVLERADHSGIDRTIREVMRGETVGEMALITGGSRSATVVALRDTELGILSREAFAQLLEREPRSVLGLTRTLARWLTLSNQPETPSSSPSTVAIVALGGPAPIEEFARSLTRALSALGPTLHLSATTIELLLGTGMSRVSEGDTEYPGITRWLNDQEADYRFIVYQADTGLTAWTLRCLSQADRVFRIASSESSANLGPVGEPRGSASLVGGATDHELVLMHRDKSPENTDRWLALGEFTTHHHIRTESSADYDRLARHLAGRAVGVVLGGGGARGFAHIGVLRALEEARIPIDRLGGASMGAVIAAQYASGMALSDMIDLNRRAWTSFRPHRDYTLPLISLLSGRAAGRMLKMMFGDQRFEDLWLNCFCVSTNLSRATLMVHRSGPVRRWLRASMAIPGSAPPMIGDGGDLLIDGGVLDNVPVAAMRALGPSSIIAVDVSPNVDLVVDPTLKLAPTPWEVLRSRFRPADDRRSFPSLFQILYRTSILASIRADKLGRGDLALYLEPPVAAFDTFRMEAIDQIVEAGYHYAVAKIASAENGLGR
jgi:predicted acylesterase/phospholipase RssA/CRP-like cAMP-binding protein